MNNAPLHRTHYPALDGLRGVAIILVLLYHNFSFIPIFIYGWLGVDLFFVLSGFLITDILLQTRDTQNYFRNFYARRVLRIFPVYYLSLLLFIIILPSFSWFPLDMHYYREQQFWFWTYLQNWTLVFHFDQNANVLTHFWSLALEEQYYLVWPLILLLVRKPRTLITLCLLLLLTVVGARLYVWNHRDLFSTWQWLFLFTRVDGILIGSMLALIYRINSSVLDKYSTHLILFLAGINFLVYFIDKHNYFPVWAIIGYSTFSVLFALLVYESVRENNKVINVVFTNPALRFFGKYSYGLYIFHWPVFLLIKPHTDEWMAHFFVAGKLSFLVFSALLATLAGLAVSVLSFHLFEKHFLRLKKSFA
jgi:peptidoglycan/LPS O-acetylase OafA/YrhL